MKTNYERSRHILSVDIHVSKISTTCARKLLQSADTATRQLHGDTLLDELSDAAEIDIVTLKISDAKQYHRRRHGRVTFKQYGYYRPTSRYIYIHNRTAVRGQIVAPKTFLDTLLHEWVHHYDHCKLGLNSIHSAGFYARIRDLKTKLLLV
jgi:hypothetical protein